MYGKLVIDGNAVYEIDEACLFEKRDEKNGRSKRLPGNGMSIEIFSGSSSQTGRTGIRWTD